jgi:hypothetical protein
VFHAAIDTLAEAERYAATKDFRLEFGPEDVRALAISLFIAADKRTTVWQQ